MKTILVDSDVLIEVSRGRKTSILQQWEDLAASDAVLLCSPVTVAEIWHGARPAEHEVLDALFSALISVPVDIETGRRAGEYLRRYHASHNVEPGDALIGATAVVHQAALWTGNRKYYPMPEIEFW